MALERLGSGLAFLAAWFLVAILGAAATLLWVRRLWKRRAELKPATLSVAALMAAAVVYGTLGTVVTLGQALNAVSDESQEPSQKALVLAEGIADAMNFTASGLLVWLPTAATVAFLTRKRPQK